MPSLPPRPVPALVRPLLPLLRHWAQHVAATHRAAGLSVDALGFETLARYFPGELLATTRVVVLERLPHTRLPSFGFAPLREFAASDARALSLLDVCFVRPRYARDEALLAHELVHTVQWAHLGPARFVEAYAAGLLERGYDGCPLEVMAREHAERFVRGAAPYDVARAVRRELGATVRARA